MVTKYQPLCRNKDGILALNNTENCKILPEYFGGSLQCKKLALQFSRKEFQNIFPDSTLPDIIEIWNI